MEEEKSLKETIAEMNNLIAGRKNKNGKPKKFRIPYKGRVGKKKMKDGFATVVVIEENKNIDFTREPIIDGTIKLKDTFHAIDSEEVFFYKNKPLIFQTKKKLNPYNPLKGENETYGQKYVMARMEGDKIISKKSMGMGITVGALIIAAVIAYALIAG